MSRRFQNRHSNVMRNMALGFWSAPYVRLTSGSHRPVVASTSSSGTVTPARLPQIFGLGMRCCPFSIGYLEWPTVEELCRVYSIIGTHQGRPGPLSLAYAWGSLVPVPAVSSLKPNWIPGGSCRPKDASDALARGAEISPITLGIGKSRSIVLS